MPGSVSLLLASILSLSPLIAHPAVPHVPSRLPQFEASMLTRSDRRVRTTNGRIHQLLADGVTRSRTFAGLVAALNHTDVIVYIEVVPDLPGSIAGRLLLVPLANAQRYLRIQIQPEAVSRDAIALIGHELRHALEIAAEPHVRDQRGMIELYRRIGKPSLGLHQYDTIEAQSAGRQVRAELAS
ncbi:MAG TPA: hypothetical protein VD833_10660 [Vicinamibacterales bacterium]|nr:hypothetical protein [Vicinamibacterales bacterium]